MTKITFKFRCSYMNTVNFDCFKDGEKFELELRYGVCDYERKIYNGDYDAECVPFLNILLFARWPDRLRPVPQDIVDAFNAYRKADVDDARAYFERKYPNEAPSGDWATEIPYKPIVRSEIPAGTELARLAAAV